MGFFSLNGALRRAGTGCMLLATLAACTPKAEMAAAIVAADPSRCYLEPLASIPVSLVRNHAWVPFAVNGVGTFAMLDTGSGVTIITPALAQKAGQLQMIAEHLAASGLTGALSLQVVRANTARSGGLSWVSPLMSIYPIFGPKTGVPAVLGANMLAGLDLDLDFAHGQVEVYRNYNCKSIEPPWQDTDTGLALTRIGRSGLVTIPVAFEGDVLDAVVDTGATEAQLLADPEGHVMGADGAMRPAKLHTFAKIAIGEDLFSSFPMDVATDIHAGETERMVLGMDYLSKHRIWLSYSTNAFYTDSGEKRQDR